MEKINLASTKSPFNFNDKKTGRKQTCRTANVRIKLFSFKYCSTRRTTLNYKNFNDNRKRFTNNNELFSTFEIIRPKETSNCQTYSFKKY